MTNFVSHKLRVGHELVRKIMELLHIFTRYPDQLTNYLYGRE